MTTALKHIQRQGDYHYFRHPSIKRVRLDGTPGSPEYNSHYQRLLASARPAPMATAEAPPAPAPAILKFLPGSVGWVIEQFKGSQKYRRLASGTRVAYDRELCLIKDECGGVMIADLRRSHIKLAIANIAKAHTDSVGDRALTLMRMLWKFARDLPECKISDDASNPARDIAKRYQVKQEHLPWPEPVQAKFNDGASAKERLGFALLKWTGQRGGDVCNMRWDHIDSKGILHVTQEKTGAHVPLRIHSKLAKILAETPRDGEYILGLQAGTLTHKIQARLREIGEGDRYTMHGLRKTAAVALAEAGATETELMRVFGWATSKQATYYTRRANAHTIVDNAMAKWEAAEAA